MASFETFSIKRKGKTQTNQQQVIASLGSEWLNYRLHKPAGKGYPKQPVFDIDLMLVLSQS